MTIDLELKVNAQSIRTGSPKIVRRTRNVYRCHFSFSEDWAGYVKTAVFKDGTNETEYLMVLDNNDTCLLPYESLAGETLFIGVFGVKDDQDYPTVWSKSLPVEDGVIDGDPLPEPTPEIFEQIMSLLNTKSDRIDIEDNIIRLFNGETLLSEIELDFGVVSLEIKVEDSVLKYRVNDDEWIDVLNIDALLEGYATEEWVESQNYLIEHQSLDGVATEEWVEGKGYLTEHQSLQDYDTSEEVNRKISDARESIASEFPSVEGFATEMWVENKGYQIKEDVAEAISESLIGYYNKREIDLFMLSKASAADLDRVESAKADKISVYTRVEIQNYLKDKANNTDLNVLSGRVSDLESNAAGVRNVIPEQASTTNKLADRDFVNTQIENVAAYYVTKDAEGNPFETFEELQNATIFYSGGQLREPTRNDYTIVLKDESHAEEGTEPPTTRYIYNNGWSYQYTVNNSGLTSDQWIAVNSGITKDAVSQIETNKLAVANKADKSTTLQGYNITDAYTKSETDNIIEAIEDTVSELEESIKDGVGIQIVEDESEILPNSSVVIVDGDDEVPINLATSEDIAAAKKYTDDTSTGLFNRINGILSNGYATKELLTSAYNSLSTEKADKTSVYTKDEVGQLVDRAKNMVLVKYNQTSREDVESAYNAGKSLICDYLEPNLGSHIYLPLVLVGDTGNMYFSGVRYTSVNRNIISCFINKDGGWNRIEDSLNSCAFIIDYGSTDYSGLLGAIEKEKPCYCKYNANGNILYVPLMQKSISGNIYFSTVRSTSLHQLVCYMISPSGVWTDFTYDLETALSVKADESSVSSRLSAKADKKALEELDRREKYHWELSKGTVWDFETKDQISYSVDVPTGAHACDIQSIGGRSAVWNQIGANSRYTADDNSTVVTAVPETDEYEFVSTGGQSYLGGYPTYIDNVPNLTDRYYISYYITDYSDAVTSFTAKINYTGEVRSEVANVSGKNKRYGFISRNTKYTTGKTNIWIGARATSYNSNTWFKIRKDIQVTNLTKMFGEEVANKLTVEDCDAMFNLKNYGKVTPTVIHGACDLIVIRSKNIWDEAWESGSINLSSSGASYQDPECIRSKNYIECIPNTSYYLFVDGYEGNIRITYYDSNKKYLGTDVSKSVPVNSSFTTPNDAKYMRFYLRDTDNPTYAGKTISITKGEAPIDTRIIEMPQAIKRLNGYGWSVGDEYRNEVDFENKKFIKRVERVELNGNESWDYNPANPNRPYLHTYYFNAISSGYYPKICAEYTYYGKPWSDSSVSDMSISENTNASIPLMIFRDDTNATSLVDWKLYLAERYAAGNPLVVYIPLNDPVVTDISDIIDSLEVEHGCEIVFRGSADNLGINLPIYSKEEFIIKLSEV